MSEMNDFQRVQALAKACKENDVAVTQAFIADGVDINVANKKGFTPLFIACTFNNIKIVKLLLDNGADPNLSCGQQKTTALHAASQNGAYKMAALLLRSGSLATALDKDGQMPIHACANAKDPNKELFMLLYLCDTKNTNEDVHMQGIISSFMGAEMLPTRLNDLFQQATELINSKKSLDFSRKELVSFAPSSYCNYGKLKSLNLSHNYLKIFPRHVMLMIELTSLNLSHNQIPLIPMNISTRLPNLSFLDLSHNKIEDIPSDITNVANLDLLHNPLSSIPSVFRDDKNKLLFYAKYGGKKEPWEQIKLMLVGHEGVGKTTFLKCLQGQPKGPNVSTNGVDITHVELPVYNSDPRMTMSLARLTKKREKVVCKVWDFGGQTVFHSTHRFFLTASAIYVIVYNIADEKTHSRLQHWMQQITSIVDTPGNSMPILIVGTHADKLTKPELEEVLAKISKAYPRSKKPTGVQGHFAVSLSVKNDPGLQSLKEAIVEIAKDHPKIGVGKVKVPSFLMLIKAKIEQLQMEQKFLSWYEYKELCQEVILVEDFPIVEWTQILQELGVLIWNNAANLKDIVIINPQWLADALAGVVTMVNQGNISRTGGVVHKSKLYNIMKTKIAEVQLFPTIFGLLERFEIILRMRNYYSNLNALVERPETDDNAKFDAEEDYKYFVPSLLLPYDHKKDLAHPAMQFWKRLYNRPGFSLLKRRFTWKAYPSAFFPRLLLRLMHMQMSLLGSWVDAAVIMSQDQAQYSFLHLYSSNSLFYLDVTVLQDKKTEPTQLKSRFHTREALISELAYAVARLDRDMWEDTPADHHIIINFSPSQLVSKSTLSLIDAAPIDEEDKPNATAIDETPISFAECMALVGKNENFITVKSQQIRLDAVVPDLSSCLVIPARAISNMKKIGEGGFGIVYKATLKDMTITNTIDAEVAVKEMIKVDVYDDPLDQESREVRKIYEFQHEMLIMSKVKHSNLVQLYGILKSPLSLVMEFVPCGDLHQLIRNNLHFSTVNFKWRLKMAIDVARAMSHLHKQTPPICHSDLRAPNIFVASMDPEADIIGKVADFGLAQQIFPFSVQVLGNLVETAPETWGDEGVTKGVMYDERSDVFSFSIILWRLFGSKTPNVPVFNSSSFNLRSSNSSISSNSSSNPNTPPISPLSSLNNSFDFGDFSNSPPISPKTLRTSKSFIGSSRLGETNDSHEFLDENDPYGHLRDKKGNSLNKWTLRNKIREGERPIISSTCPNELKQIIEECWQFDPAARPYFPLLVQRLHEIYANYFGIDKYLAQAVTNPNAVLLPKPSDELLKSSLNAELKMKNWEPKPYLPSESWSVVSLVLIDDQVWAGTNTGALLLINAKTGKFAHLIALQKSGRVGLLQAGPSCIWASSETEKICMIHTQTKYKLTEIDNEATVTCMAISYHHAGPTAPVVWVADTKGCISLWDLTTVQKYCKFAVKQGETNPPVVRQMSVMQEHMWCAVGGDIVVIETQSLQKIMQFSGSSRLNFITTVPSTRQTWTCAKDGTIRVWELKKKIDKQMGMENNIIELVKSIKHTNEVKFVHTISSTFVPLSRGHVVAGDFNGTISMWNAERLDKPEMFPMPEASKNHAIQCALDTGEYGLWLGTMNRENPLMRYNSNPYFEKAVAMNMSQSKSEYLLGSNRMVGVSI